MTPEQKQDRLARIAKATSKVKAERIKTRAVMLANRRRDLEERGLIK